LETALIPQKQKNKNRNNSFCFNPCFIGNCSHTAENQNNFCRNLCFNPCFIGNCSHTKKKKRLKPRCWPVSILVLLETALIPKREKTLYCSSSMFQSLFYWKLLSYQSPLAARLQARTCFNPCFIGNCSHTRITEEEKKALKLCFNPCFIGNCSHTAKKRFQSVQGEVFQSLFYWKLLSYI